MDNRIFYFSGTGNSLAVAKDIAEKIGQTDLISVADALRDAPVQLTGERIGFVFPSYYACVPAIVKRLISTLEFRQAQYLFGVVTFGGAYGTTLAQLSRAVAERQGVLNAGFSVRMPGNYIDKYGAFPLPIQKIFLKGEKKKVERIASAVRAKQSGQIPRGSRLIRRSEEKNLNRIAGFGAMAENFHPTEKCTGCGTCERLCPVENIKLTDGRPVWGNVCEHCEACIQWCPQKAVEYADKTAKRTRYHNPEVTVSELTARSKGQREEIV
jgi:MinD superfamily P-loop ATPase containing an inserted ferredoxin domain